MTFAGGTQKEKNIFTINKHPIENVKNYKYLGVTINAKNCTFNPTMADLRCKATNALYAINSKIHLKLMPIKTALKIFDACISPILQYGSEVCCPYLDNDYKKWDLSPIEKIHTQFLKRILGVNYSTTNILVRRECGRNPLQEKILTRNINYIKYVTNKSNNTLVKQALNYENSKEESRITISNMVKQHKVNIENYLKENENIWNISKHKLKSATYQYFNQLWVEQTPLYTKAETYKLFKNKVGLEAYLTNTKIRKLRVTFTKFRLSDHNLMIEQGRRKRPQTPRDERICPLCSEEVENEIHFLIKCTSRSTERKLLFTEIQKLVPTFSTLDPTSKFVYLLSQEDKYISKLLIKQIHLWSQVHQRVNI